MKILIIGNGWLGNRCADEWPDAVLSKEILKDGDDILKLLDLHQPDVVLNAAGVVGKPNVDWCEDHVIRTAGGNTVLPIMLAQACAIKNVYLLHIGTGCVYYGYKEGGWKPNDVANPEAVYTRTKYAADLVLSKLKNVGIARIRMPIDSIPHPGNLIDKLASYESIVDVENSVTVVEDMIKVFRKMFEQKVEGIHHVVNPNVISHREIMSIYKTFINNDFVCNWIDERELVEKGLAKKRRSNNYLNSDSLGEHRIYMPNSYSAVVHALTKYKENLCKKQ